MSKAEELARQIIDKWRHWFLSDVPPDELAALLEPHLVGEVDLEQSNQRVEKYMQGWIIRLPHLKENSQHENCGS